MNIVCLDFEGVLIPDIWPIVAQKLQIPDLLLTTRDIADYSQLMDQRVEICHKNNITLKIIQDIVQTLKPLPDALDFVSWVKNHYQLIILSDTFYEFVNPLVQQLDFPTLFCHTIAYNMQTKKLKYTLRQKDQKRHAVLALKNLNFQTFASGDSYNDTSMMSVADGACFFNATEKVHQEFSQYTNAQNYEQLKEKIQTCFQA